MKKALLALLLVFLFLSAISLVFAQAGPDLPHPQKVRLCFGISCQTLTASGDFYNVPPDGQSGASWQYGIVNWTANMAIMSGKRSTPAKDGGEVSGTCLGSMNPKGTGVDNGRGTMVIGKQNLTVVCTMAWDSAPTPPAPPQPTPPPIDQKPQTMRLQTNHAEILTWKGDHYDGVQEGQTAPMSRYTVERWDAGGVRFVGSPLAVPPGTFKVIFTGKLAPAGGSVADSNLQVIVNGKQTFNGPGFALTWDVKPASAAPAATPPPAPAAVATAPVAAPVAPPPAPTQAKVSPPLPPQPKVKAAPPAKSEVAQKTGDAGVPPKLMRLCINVNQCWDLNWVSDHYEGHNNNPVFPDWRFWITSWEGDHVVFTGKTQKAFPGSDFPLEGTFSGKVSAKGSSIFDGRFDWKVGYSQSGVYPITLTWDKTPSNVADVADISVYKTAHQSQNHPNISLPPGAAELFAEYPSDIRQLLLPTAELSPSDSKLPCDSLNQVSAEEALEIGKFAFRAADFPRGYCWTNRSKQMGNARARVIVGIAQLFAWGTTKNESEAFVNIKSAADDSHDIWGYYFLIMCYRHGYGTPVNKEEGDHIDRIFSTSPAGGDLIMTIGSDDQEIKKSFERMQVFMNPPQSSSQVCDYSEARARSHTPPCHTETHVNQERMTQELSDIDAKYPNAPASQN